MNQLKNLLIVRTDRIGDVILSLPLAEIVKKHNPDCRITYLVRKYTRTLAEGNPFIDEIIDLEEKDGNILLGENIKILKQHNFDACIIVYPTITLSLIIFLSGIKTRIGSGYRWYSIFFNKRIFEHRKYAEKHELEYNVGLLKALGINEYVSRGKVAFHLKENEVEHNSIQKLLKEKGVDVSDKIIILHPGSGGSSIDLPIENMVELTRLITTLEKVKIIITGNKSEVDLCRKFEINDSVINLAGLLKLSELKSLINMCNLFISNSTGPIHIAAALDKYVIGFYPKILACSVERWGPYTQKRTIFSPSLDCQNCTRIQCEKLNCMNSIDIGRVFDETQAVLNIS